MNNFIGFIEIMIGKKMVTIRLNFEKFDSQNWLFNVREFVANSKQRAKIQDLIKFIRFYLNRCNV